MPDTNLTLLGFLIRYGIWVAPERLNSFLQQYLSESAYISQSHGHQLTVELVELILANVEWSSPDMLKRYHMLQSLSLLTQLLSQQEACFVLGNHRSRYNVLPRIVEALNALPADMAQTHPQLFKLMG
jgi:hypothetical protein